MPVGGTGDVVQTALDVIGSPYQWGGTEQNGFDCSGLIQYAYGRHGIRLPRMSRDQAQAGSAIPPVLDSLRPGDILAFAARSAGPVTHVGMYIGEGKFIHSSTTGVRLSRLEREDPDGKYWIPRWVGVRRILP
jgi:cell wall-associated NlpC family hydrolase